MFSRNRAFCLGAILSAAALAGCPGKTVNSVALSPSTTVAAEPGGGANALIASPTDRARRHSRQASHSSWVVFSNPEYGISFHYPRDYALEEGEIEEHSFLLRRQDELEPGATLLATVLIPEDGYPNTTFQHGSLQVIVDETLSPTGCREVATPTAGQADLSAVGTITADGVPFWWSQESLTTAGSQIVERAYAGFSGGKCYEFFSVVALGEATDLEGMEKQADTGKILRQLEKIFLSLELDEAPAAPDRVSRAFNEPR